MILLYKTLIFILAIYFSGTTVVKLVDGIMNGKGNITLHLIITSIFWGLFYFFS